MKSTTKCVLSVEPEWLQWDRQARYMAAEVEQLRKQAEYARNMAELLRPR